MHTINETRMEVEPTVANDIPVRNPAEDRIPHAGGCDFISGLIYLRMIMGWTAT